MRLKKYNDSIKKGDIAVVIEPHSNNHNQKGLYVSRKGS